MIENTVDRENDGRSLNLHEFELWEDSIAVLNIVRAKELENRDIIGTLNPYVLVKYRGRICKDFITIDLIQSFQIY